MPTAAEWQAMPTGAEACDGLGTPFRYQVLGKPSGEDGQSYRIDSLPGRPVVPAGDHWVPPNASDLTLGRDGLFGTRDDDLGRMSLDANPQSWTHCPHARAARARVSGMTES